MAMPVISNLKAGFRTRIPGIYAWLQERVGHPARYRRAARVVERVAGSTVQDGPFRGMKLATTVTGSYVPKLLGMYEQELHPIVDEIIRYRPATIVDVGCGEGFYLVGLAMRLPGTTCIGFDIDAAAKMACLEQAHRNGVSRQVQIRDCCDHSALSGITLKSAVVIADCEGFERELLNPDLVPGLRSARILVEIHELFAPGVTTILKERFAPSHHLRLIDAKPRDPSEYRLLDGLSRSKARMLMDERRPGPMQWAWMTPRSDAS